jgi:hypothetical protein
VHRADDRPPESARRIRGSNLLRDILFDRERIDMALLERPFRTADLFEIVFVERGHRSRLRHDRRSLRTALRTRLRTRLGTQFARLGPPDPPSCVARFASRLRTRLTR